MSDSRSVSGNVSVQHDDIAPTAYRMATFLWGCLYNRNPGSKVEVENFMKLASKCSGALRTNTDNYDIGEF